MILIREAGEKDFQKLIEIMKRSASEDELKGFIPADRLKKRIHGAPHKFLEELREALKLSEHGIIVAEKDGKPVGFAFSQLKRDHIEIEEIDVVKEYQRQGVGKALVQYIERNAREKGIKRLETGALINRKGKPWMAYGFWLRMGFKDAGIKLDTSDGLRYVSLIKILNSP